MGKHLQEKPRPPAVNTRQARGGANLTLRQQGSAQETRPEDHEMNGPFIRGRGYWFWKPALVKYLVRRGQIRENDIVIWLDPDNLRLFGVPDLDWETRLGYFNTRNSMDGIDILVQAQPWCEFKYTKADIFDFFNTTWRDPHYGLTTQAHAQFWVSAMNKRTLKFMQTWEDLNSKFHLISDEKSVLGENDFFQGNRHDQSLLSMLMKAQGAPIYDGGGTDCRSAAGLPDVSVRDPHGNDPIRQKHPIFGIANLNAVVGHFDNRTLFTGPRVRVIERSAHVGKPKRNIYVRGERIDLDLDNFDDRGQ